MSDEPVKSAVADHRRGDRPLARLTQGENGEFLGDQEKPHLASGSSKRSFFGVFVQPR